MTSDDAQKPGCFGFVIDQLRKLLGRMSPTPASLPYRVRDDFLSPAELSYYRVLTSVLGLRATVLAKVRLADILFVPEGNDYIRFFNRISQRHVDFLLCEASNMRPVLVIELDDRSHSGSRRKERDLFIDEALKAAEVPILRVAPRAQYSREEVIAQLRPFLSPSPPPERPPSPDSRIADQPSPQASPDGEPPMCPKCGVPMVLRVATQGDYKGRHFYGCRNYPRCRQVLPLDEPRLAG